MLTEAAKRVREGTMAPAKLLALEKAIGFNHNPVGLLADVDLRKWVRIGEVASFDWMHSALQDGTLTTDMFFVLSIAFEYRHPARTHQGLLESRLVISSCVRWEAPSVVADI